MATYEELRKEMNDVRLEFFSNLEKMAEDNPEEYAKLLGESSIENLDIDIAPRSSAGKIYKYDRGVIGIDKNGKKEEINLDLFDMGSGGHPMATLFIGCLLNEEIKNKYQDTMPIMAVYESAKLVTEYGICIAQLEGNQMFIYYPETPTDIQKEILQREIDVRKDKFEFKHIECSSKSSKLI